MRSARRRRRSLLEADGAEGEGGGDEGRTQDGGSLAVTGTHDLPPLPYRSLPVTFHPNPAGNSRNWPHSSCKGTELLRALAAANKQIRTPAGVQSRTTAAPEQAELTAPAARLADAPLARPAPDPYNGVPFATDTEEVIAGYATQVSHADVRQLAHAVDGGTAITIEYVATTGSRTIRTISGLELDPPYLFAWCHLRDAERVFTLSRIHWVMPPAERRGGGPGHARGRTHPEESSAGARSRSVGGRRGVPQRRRRQARASRCCTSFRTAATVVKSLSTWSTV
ncbi:WYL domain-containing protein [Streptomyces sp. Ru62]|uniref:WYL domain-containing protein n=1 Tax=Streptomyces sp. Ru62 TaxID=2080745 RepID=UPI0035BC32A3